MNEHLGRMLTRVAAIIVLVGVGVDVRAEEAGVARGIDARVRQVIWQEGRVYPLRGFSGYQVHLQFEEGERFVGLGAGDIEGIAFEARDHHLFLKPRAAGVRTNLTVVTDRRIYQLEYEAVSRRPDPLADEVVYSMKFVYPVSVAARELLAAAAREAVARGRADAAVIEQRLTEGDAPAIASRGPGGRARNLDYWFCGDRALRPVGAWDDGVHTRIRFASRAERPALFVRNEDGVESLLNFSVDREDIVVHRVAREFVLRRGGLTGCIVNKGYAGSGERLGSGTVAPGVSRVRRGEVRP